MNGRVEVAEGTAVSGGITVVFPAGDDDEGSFSLPKRLRRRLLDAECNKTPITVEQIEAKLRQADLRRQKYFEKVSSKARAKPRGTSMRLSQAQYLGQRLEAKMHAAEQKRLSILTKDQMRLARADELRQAAKTGVKTCHENERAKLWMKVELRLQQAEANRMLLLNARRQRRACHRERSSESMMRWMARQNKYKERVRATTHQKLVAAETKRLGFLEAWKRKAGTRVMKVRRVVKYVSHQREIEGRKKNDELEDRLQRAKRKRAEYLRQRGRLLGYGRAREVE